MLARNFVPRGTIDISYKDQELETTFAKHLGVPLLLANVTLQVYQMARAAGLNKEDGSSIIKVFERMAGVTIGDQTVAYDSPNYLWFRQRYRRFVYVDRVVVAPAARGRGYARLLYADLFCHARQAGHNFVVCEVNSNPPSPASDAMHATLAFADVGREHTSGSEDSPLSRPRDRASFPPLSTGAGQPVRRSTAVSLRAATRAQLVGAPRARHRQFFHAARCGDDPRAHRLADLDRGQNPYNAPRNTLAPLFKPITEFVPDSPLEGDGFELSVPRSRKFHRSKPFRSAPMPFRIRSSGSDSCGPYRDGEVTMLKSSPNFTRCAAA